LPPGPEWLALFAFVAAGADGDEVRSDVPATPAFCHDVIEGEDTCFDAAVGAGATEAGFDFGADMMFARSVVEIHCGSDRVWLLVNSGINSGLRGELPDYAPVPPVAQARASKETPLKWTQTASEPGLAGFPY
jgi:hypothetical protein